MKKLCRVILAVGFVMALATSARAITMGSIPGGTAENDFIAPIGPLFSGPSIAGWYGGQLYLTGTADVTLDYFGAEAGYHNEFNFNGVELFDHVGGSYEIATDLLHPIDTATVYNVSAGLLNFSFDYNNNAGSVVNGSNPDDSSSQAGPNFFVSFDPFNGIGGPTCGNYVYVFLDDGGAGPDDNHDDMLVRISVKGNINTVPEPGTMLLLGTGLLGLGLIRRRQQTRG